ncbi:MAG: TonB-dependent receptor, partial [Acidobacteria bacterium]|nr:TonB-dependent receptor [Candidatus Sulfomarinibacter kjeldsenii]
MKRLNLARFSAAFVLLTLSIASTVAAGAESGSLVGVVRGPGGVGLPGVRVTANSAGETPTASVVTGDHGAFRIDDLEPGTYSVEGEIRGFHPTSAPGVTIENGGVAQVVLSLSVATFRDTMQVNSQSPDNSIEASELRESTARDLGEAMANKPGVWKVRKGGIANDVVIKGYGEDDLTILIDGARVAGACP